MVCTWRDPADRLSTAKASSQPRELAAPAVVLRTVGSYLRPNTKYSPDFAASSVCDRIAFAQRSC